MNICVCAPQTDAYSETFIRDHITRLPGKVYTLCGALPDITGENGPLIPRLYRVAIRRPKFFPMLAGASVVRRANNLVGRYLQQRNIAVVLAEYGPTAVAFAEPCRAAGIPLVVHFHGYDIYKRDILAYYHAAYEKLFRDAAAMIVGSRAMQQHLQQLTGSSERIYYNPCGVDPAQFTPVDAGRNPLVFAAVGRFVEKKAPHITLLAFREVLAALPAAKLVMIGDGVLLDACKQLAEALGIAHAVSFPGALSHSGVAETLANARAFVQHSVTAPSGDSEGTAISVLEAAATALPIVSTRHGGIQDTMIHGQTAFLVDELDFRAMARYVICLGENPQLAVSMGQCAYRHVVANHSMDRSIEGLHRILTQAAAKQRQNSPLMRRDPTPYQYTRDLETLLTGSVDERITVAMRSYLGGALGWKDPAISDRINLELTRAIPKGIISYIESVGQEIRGKTILDLGAGLGGLSAELASRGARVIAIEPGSAWRQITKARLHEAGSGNVIGSVGEALPFASDSFDLVISLQVLEHVQDPPQVLREVFRVLRPGGFFFMACENYMAFREQHYRVAWFPLLPKAIGAVYLRLRGRSPEFLRNGVTYTTLPGILKAIRQAGFIRPRETEVLAKLRAPGTLKTGWKRAVFGIVTKVVPESALFSIAITFDAGLHLFRVGIREILQKPAPLKTRS